MIFVTLGTQKFQFNRLLKVVDDLVAEGHLDNVFAQVGHSDYVPQNYEYKDFLSKDAFQDCVRDCDLLITHSGVATIITGLKMEKPIVVVPRLSKFAEHVDDHQLQIAKSFSEQNFVMMCQNADDLAQIVTQAKNYQFAPYVSQRQQVTKTIRDYLETI